MYNKLCDFIRKQYWVRGYQEVITPNIFNLNLWEISGHAQHYKENMFVFDVENQVLTRPHPRTHPPSSR